MRLRAAAPAALVGMAVVLTLVLAGPTRPAMGEEVVVRALSAARGQGFFFEIGERRALFVGAFHGVLYVETGPTTLDGISIVCPANFVLNRFDPEFTAEGYCTFARGEADKMYARWTCTGRQLGGCQGRLTLDGGTGRFAGVAGGSELVIRAGLAEFSDPPSAGVVVRETASVLILLRDLRYRLP